MDGKTFKKEIYGDCLTRNEAAVVKGNKNEVINGHYTESKEIIGDYIAIRVDNLHQALQLQKLPYF